MAALVAALVEGQHAFPKQKWVVRYSPLPTNPGVFKGIFNGIFKVSSISLSAPHGRPHCKRGASNFGGIGREPWEPGDECVKAVFVVTSGRTGSTSILHMLNQIPGPGTEIRDGAGSGTSGTCWNPRFGGCLVFLESEFFFWGGANAFTTVHHSPTAEVRHQRRTEPALRVGWCFRVALEIPVISVAL